VAPDAGVEIDAPPYPAFAATLPQVGKGSGAVMASVRVVPVFMGSDPLRADLLDFLGKLAASPVWAEMVGEYGVGGLTVGTPIDVASAPASITDAEIESYVQQQVTGTSPPWGVPDATTLYVLLYPAATAIHSGPFTSCVVGGFSGSHTFAPGPGASPIVYAVIARCTDPVLPVLELTTDTLTHEIVEAATDPTVQTWNLVGDRDQAWSLLGGPELADLCELEDLAPYTPADIGHVIERTWSNAAASTGADPCRPVPPDPNPYFAAVPDQPDSVGQGPNGGAIPGVAVQTGTVRTIAVHVFSAAATSGPITVQAFSLSPTIEVALDRDHASNGDTLQLAIRADHASRGLAPFVLITSIGQRVTNWPGIVQVTP
jgi:hypothetical protein